MKQLSKRITAGILCLLLCCTLLPNTVLAADGNNLGITGEGVTATVVEQTDQSLHAIKEEAVNQSLGFYGNPLMGESGYGTLLSTFKIECEQDIAQFTMPKPEIDDDDYGVKQSLLGGERYKILVQDANHPDSPVYVFSTELENSKLTVKVPMLGSDSILCAIALYNTNRYLDWDGAWIDTDEDGYEDSPAPIGSFYRTNSAQPSQTVIENVSGSLYHYEWTYTPTIGADEFYGLDYADTEAEIRLWLGNLILDEDSVTLNTDAFEIDKIQDQEDGNWCITLKKPESFSDTTSIQNSNGDGILLAFDAELPHSNFSPDKDLYVIS